MNPTIWEKIKTKLSESSTIRGLILLIGLLGYKLSPEEIAAWVALADFVVYIAYEVFREDSATKAISSVFSHVGGAKKGPNTIASILLPVLLILPLFLAAGQAMAADLYISAQGTIDKMEVVIENSDTDEVIESNENLTDFVAVGPDGAYTKYRIMNVDHLAPGLNYRIVVLVCNGEWCDTSDPLLTGRPGIAAGSLMIQ